MRSREMVHAPPVIQEMRQWAEILCGLIPARQACRPSRARRGEAYSGDVEGLSIGTTTENYRSPAMMHGCSHQLLPGLAFSDTCTG
jgi:hypothetical protein